MERTDERWQHPNGRWTFRLRTFRCCGIEYEIFLSKNYPERETWTPGPCIKCGSVYKEPNPAPKSAENS
jgi:hypothetical protein